MGCLKLCVKRSDIARRRLGLASMLAQRRRRPTCGVLWFGAVDMNTFEFK